MDIPYPQLPRQDVLPFPPTPSASTAGRTMQESTYAQRAAPSRLRDDSPNVLVVLIDDAGPGLPTTFGGEVTTDTLTRVVEAGSATTDSTPQQCAHRPGGAGGGLTCFMDDGYICYEYNCFILMRTKFRSEQRLPSGRTSLEISTVYSDPRPGGALEITIGANGDRIASGTVPVSAPLLFSANDCLDIGICLGSPVSLDYYDRAPFPFTDHVDTVTVRYLT